MTSAVVIHEPTATAKRFLVFYFVRGRRQQHGNLVGLELALQDLRALKRRGLTAWVEDENGSFVPVPGTKRKPAELKASEHVHKIPGDGNTGPAIPVPDAKLPKAQSACGCVPEMKLVRPEACLADAARLGPLDSTEKFYRLLHPILAKEDQETVIMVPLDLRFQLKGGYVEVHRGARTHVETTRVDAFRAAVLSGATYFVVVHGHPSGRAQPSAADRHMHREIERFTKATGKGEVTYLDSIVIGRGEYASVRSGRVHRV